MANMIKCPVCGESNPSDQEFCHFCQSRLQPLTGPLKGMDETLKPGQTPTKRDTGELEGILPQWLREARSSAREISEDDETQESHPTSSGGDLLAGLRATRQTQDNEEEDVPDWLTSITGETPKSKKSPPESSEVRWVELGGKDDFPQGQEESATKSETLSRLEGLKSSTPQPDEKDELTDWFRDASNTPKQQQPIEPSFEDNSFSAPPAGDTPDWLRAMAAENDSQNDNKSLNDSGNIFDSSSASSDTPDWLRSMASEDHAQKDDASLASGKPFDLPSVSSDTPDWLRSIAAEDASQNNDASSNDLNNIFDAAPASSDMPDWLKRLPAQDQTEGADSALFSETSSGEPPAGITPGTTEDQSDRNVPDWLKGLESETSTSSSDQDWLNAPIGAQAGENEQPTQEETPAWLKTDVPDAETEIPAWLSDAPASDASRAAPEQKEPSATPEQDASHAAFGDVPSWLIAAAPQSSIFGESPVEQGVPTPSEPPSEPSSDTPDWLNAFKSDDAPESQAVPAFSADVPADKPPAFMDDSQTGGNTDALFTDMPDWLSNVDDSSSSPSTPTPITNADAIAPGELPSWVQAMRPVDSGIPQSSSSLLSSDQTLESRGALAGLQGVLPAAVGFAPTSKPKPYSIKLQASEEQQAQAALLEQILAAETEPVPLTSFSALAASRGLRWLLAILLFAGLTTVLILRTQLFAMPVGVPSEIIDALQVAQSIPDDAPVLVAFDYEPARAGEMEAAAAPMFDQMMLLHHPHLTFISTSATGPILTERFISGPLAGHNYQSGVSYLNLGYLPGGQLGIYAFAQDPKTTAEFAFARNTTVNSLFDVNLVSAWTSDPWSGITSLSQFAAFIIVTDNADSGRAWIEQTTSARGTIPVVVISSAQAAPMIQPYYASQQISGLVSGLYGGAVYGNDRSGTARAYWDAYSIGMLLAMVLILIGGLWNLALGARDRAAAREAK